MMAAAAATAPDATGASGTVDYWASEADLRRQVFEGQLNKFTNVVKGWQYRWFVLRPETGHLEYHLMEDTNPSSTVLLGKEPNLKIGKCRGSQHLAGCMVVPSDEDSLTFNAIFASGETYKLRASNVKERQVWVDRLRAVAHLHDKAIAQFHPPVRHQTTPAIAAGAKSHLSARGEPSEQLQHLSLSVLDAFGSVHDILHQADVKHRQLAQAISSLPLSPDKDVPACNDPDLLMIKATSHAALTTMESALAILQDLVEQRQQIVKRKSINRKSPSPLSLSPKKAANPSFESPVSLEGNGKLSNLMPLAGNSFSRSTPSVNHPRAMLDQQDLGHLDSISTVSAEEHFHDTKGEAS